LRLRHLTSSTCSRCCARAEGSSFTAAAAGTARALSRRSSNSCLPERSSACSWHRGDLRQSRPLSDRRVAESLANRRGERRTIPQEASRPAYTSGIVHINPRSCCNQSRRTSRTPMQNTPAGAPVRVRPKPHRARRANRENDQTEIARRARSSRQSIARIPGRNSSGRRHSGRPAALDLREPGSPCVRG
jgi:hypothetical protein